MSVPAGFTVRPYRPGDEEAVLDIWRATMPFDAVDEETFAQRVLADPNLDPEGFLVAEHAFQPVGFLLAWVRRVPLGPEGDLEPDTGWMSAFAVHPQFQGQGAGRLLVAAGEDFLRRRGRRRVEVGPYAPGYFWPGVDRKRGERARRLLEGMGYHPIFQAVAMDKNLVGYVVPPDVWEQKRSLEQEGYRFVFLCPRYVRSFIEFNARVFYPDWARAARETVARRLPWERTLLCIHEDEVVGYAQYGCYDHVPDRFGPFGVDDRLRGKGIGKVLLYLTLDNMRAKGYHDAWFLWTGEHTPAGFLYRRAGFEVTRVFDAYGKELDRP
jgi:mycothiol synthase